MSEPTPEPPKRRRRWFSTSLRAMMLLILVVGIPMGWKARRASLQRRAVARIERLWGSVFYDWQFKNGKLLPTPPNGPDAPKWLRKMLGDEYFQDVTKVTLPDVMKMKPFKALSPDTPVDSPEWKADREKTRKDQETMLALANDQLTSLDGLDRLESLELIGVHLNSEGQARLGRISSLKEFYSLDPFDAAGQSQMARLENLEHLTIDLTLEAKSDLGFLDRIPRLRFLFIESHKITDAGMARLGKLSNLESLFTNKTNIFDKDLACLAGLDKLKALDLESASGITDAGLAHLERLKDLERLRLPSASRITDAGLAHLEGLKVLEDLDLPSASGITDAGLAHLAGLKNLEWLNLSSAAGITDAGMIDLAALPEMKVLYLGAKPLTDAGLARLRGLSKLRDLQLYGEKISDRAKDALIAAIPGLLVEFGRDQPPPPKDDGAKNADPFDLGPFRP